MLKPPPPPTHTHSDLLSITAAFLSSFSNPGRVRSWMTSRDELADKGCFLRHLLNWPQLASYMGRTGLSNKALGKEFPNRLLTQHLSVEMTILEIFQRSRQGEEATPEILDAKRLAATGGSFLWVPFCPLPLLLPLTSTQSPDRSSYRAGSGQWDGKGQE